MSMGKMLVIKSRLAKKLGLRPHVMFSGDQAIGEIEAEPF